MIKINGLCVGIELAVTTAMHESIAHTMPQLAPFIVTTFDQWQAQMTSSINVVFVKLSQQVAEHSLEPFKTAWPGVALIAYLDDGDQLPTEQLLSYGWHGICHHDDVTSHQLALIVIMALKIKRREIKSDIYFQIAKHLADMTRFQDATASILKRICYLFQWQAGEIWAYNDLLLHLTHVVGFSDAEKYNGMNALNSKHHFKTNRGLPGYFYQHNQVDVVIECEKYLSDDYLQVLNENNFISCIGIPIRFHQQILGMMLFWCDRSVTIDDETSNLLQDIGTQLGEFIKKKRLQGDLLYLSQHDYLTQLANRSVLMDHLEQAVNQADRDHHLVALLYVDIDSFKAFNDAYGHIAGDALLKRIAECLRTCVRETDTLARIGGDEFSIVLSSVIDITHVEVVAKKVLYALSHLDMTEFANYNVSASIGISLYPYHGNRFDTLLLYADKALFAAKKSGKNTFNIFPYDSCLSGASKNNDIAALKRAIQYNEFKLYYQPIVSVDANAVIGVESLLRWPKAPVAIKSPDAFIALSEEVGLIDQIGAWVLKRACADAARILAVIDRRFKLVVNVSAYQITREFLSLVTKVLHDANLDPSVLTIELTENNLMDSSEYRLEILSSFRAMGVQLSIDDFGVGYSSFAYLNKFVVDTIKIDRSFTESMLQLASGKAIVSAILAVAHALNINVIAEGVQNQEQLDFLRAHHCEFYQGYFFSEALPIDELLIMLTPGKPS